MVRRLGIAALVLAGGCREAHLVAGGATDGGTAGDAFASDGAGADGAEVDAASDAMRAGTARLIAPLSTSTVTQQQPTLRWTGSPAAPIVDLCRDRACTQPLAIGVDVAADRNSGKVDAPLPPGWIFWRVRDGAQITPTWQFFVGQRSASTAVDASSGTIFDVNGDGYADLLIGGGQLGAAYVYLGNPVGIEMQRIDLTSPEASAGFGGMVTNLGDVNGDGFADFWVAPAGHMYLGGPDAGTAIWNGSAAPARIDSFPSYSPVPIGDVNGDGYADLLFPEPYHAFVWFGGPTPDPANLITITSTDGTGPTAPVWGNTGGAAGDVNGDGYADFVIGAYPGESDVTTAFAHLFLGNPSPSAADWDAIVSPDRIDLPGEDSDAAFGGYYGYCISPAGDLDGDGYSDFVVGAFYASSSTVAYTGKAHVYLGSPTPATADWVGSAATRRIDLVGPGYFFEIGYAMSPAGDVNGDGYADLLVGGLYDVTTDLYGTAELYLGAPDPGDAIWNGSAASHRIDLTTVDGVDGHFAYTVAGGGDTDGDGYADFAAGATGHVSGGGVAHYYRGEATPDAAHYNGPTPTLRVDITNPIDTGYFGDLRE